MDRRDEIIRLQMDVINQMPRNNLQRNSPRKSRRRKSRI